MGKNYYTADEHYGHDEIITYCNRPYRNNQVMTRDVIRRHNQVVKEGDTVHHIGDFAFAGPDRITYVENLLRRLNGKHILILGNHERINPLRLVDAGFWSVHTSLVIEEQGHKLVLAHDPSIWNCVANMDPLPIFLHGHIHNVWKTVAEKKMVNVGVDVWDFYPVSLEQILKILGMEEVQEDG
jgi:calcineurin-like phosphoesterase family protein